MTQLTMPDRTATRTGGLPAAAGRDGAHLATSARVLAARQALLAGTAAALDAPAAGLAAGLSNKQIGARLYMSHRTVGAHPYRIFPKLGIGSRDALSHQAAA